MSILGATMIENQWRISDVGCLCSLGRCKQAAVTAVYVSWYDCDVGRLETLSTKMLGDQRFENRCVVFHECSEILCCMSL